MASLPILNAQSECSKVVKMELQGSTAAVDTMRTELYGDFEPGRFAVVYGEKLARRAAENQNACH